MLLVTQNAESLLADALRNCLQEQMSLRCVVLRLSRLREKPDDWQARVTEVIERCLGGEGQIFLLGNDDVAALVRTATHRHFAQFLHALGVRLAPASLHGLAFFYELPADARILSNLFMNAPSAPGGEQTGAGDSAAGGMMMENLTATIGLRREKRVAPQILLVEDNPFFQRLLGNLFGKNFKVTIARTGADALNLYVQSAPDLVFLNIGLPDIDGFEVLARILEFDPDACVVILSGRGNRDNVLRAREMGAKGFIGKPFTADKLSAYIGRCSFIQDKRLRAAAEMMPGRHSSMVISHKKSGKAHGERRSVSHRNA